MSALSHRIDMLEVVPELLKLVEDFEDARYAGELLDAIHAIHDCKNARYANEATLVVRDLLRELKADAAELAGLS